MKYNKKIEDFLIKHNLYDETMLNYLYDNTDFIDYNLEELKDFAGCGYSIKKGKLKKMRLCMPFNADEISNIVSINILLHGIIGYKFLNKKFKLDDTIEALPLLYEKLYVIDNPSKESFDYINKIKNSVTEDSEPKYKYGVFARDELFIKYNYSLDKIMEENASLRKEYKPIK